MKNPHVIKISNRKGSALLLVLLVVSLLLVIVLAFTVYVRLELRTITEHQQLQIARQNAVLGLHLAVARLQETAGPDARSTAAAVALENAAPPLSPVTRHWTGVWKSPEGTEGVGHRRANAEQVAWLVSVDPASATPANPGTYSPPLDAEGRPTQPGDILLLGPGSVGTAHPDAHVVAPWQPIDADNRNGYAYWVADESQKALITEMTVTPLAPIDLRMETQAPGGIAADLAVRNESGDPVLTQSPGLDRNDPSGIEAWNRSMNSGHAGMVFTSPALSDMIQRQFHELTYRNSGLQVNARDGGLKKDLSIAFELEDEAFHRSEFSQELSRVDGSADPDEWVMSNPGQSFDLKPVYSERLLTGDGQEYQRSSNSAFSLNTLSSLNPDYVFRGPTWSQFRHHYRQYLEVENPFSDPAITAVPSEPNPKTHSRFRDRPPMFYYFGRQKAWDKWAVKNDVGEASVLDVHPAGNHARPRFASSNRMPSLVRMNSYYSLKTGDPAPAPHSETGAPGREMVIMQNAIVTLHNPYNTKLTVPGIYLSQQGGGGQKFEFRLTSGDPSEGQTSWFQTRNDLMYQAQPNVTSRNGSFDQIGLVLTKNGNGSTNPIVFEPGEVKVFTAVDPAPTPLSPKGLIFLKEGISANPLDDGYILTNLIRGDFTPGSGSLFDSEPYYIYEGQTFAVGAVDGMTNGSNAGFPLFGNISHAEYTGILLGLMDSDDIQRAFDSSVNKESFDKPIYWEQVLMYFCSRHLAGTPLNGIPTNYEILDQGDGFYFFYVDLYRKPTTSFGSSNEWTDVPTEILAHYNTRAPVQRSEYGGAFGKDGTRLPLSWEMAIPQDANTDLGPLPNPNRLAFDSGRGRAYWGNTLGAQGQDQLILYEVPTTPPLSLGALQHANIGLYVNEPDYIVGNSGAPADIPGDKLWLRRELTHHDNGPIGEHLYWFDTAYLTNEALWDGYFFSGAATPVNSSGNGFSTSRTVSDTLDGLPDGSTRLLNPRMRFGLPEGVDRTAYESDTNLAAYASPETSQGDLRPHDTFARYLRTAGSFNVNSTSAAAWAAMLGSLRDSALTHYDNGETPLLITPLNHESAFPKMTLSGDNNGTGIQQVFNGFLSLSDADVDRLAEEIVQQVKIRLAVHGPFRSLGQFVNRYYADSTGAIDQAGTLAAAIRVSGLNDTFNTDPDIAEQAVTDYFTSYRPDTTHSAYPNPDAFNASTFAEFGQTLTQGNLLTLLGPGLTVRGDTFKIRAHGQLRNPQTGEPVARAWCEAVVERQSDYLDATAAHPATPPDGLVAGGINDRFGRRFTIVSFRWLSPDEI